MKTVHLAKGLELDPHTLATSVTEQVTPDADGLDFATFVVRLPSQLQRRFVEAGECWEWTGGRDRNGYGHIKVHGSMRLVHRVVYELFAGPLGKKFACHRCDNPPCVRPRHIFPGDQGANMADCVAKGRLKPGLPPLGSANKWAKLSEADVTAIRLARRSGEKLRTIADRYGVTSQAICGIARGRTWKRFVSPGTEKRE